MKSPLWNYRLGVFVLCCAAGTGWCTSVFDSFEEGRLGASLNWQVQNLRALRPSARIDRIAGENWLRLRCDFGGSLTQGTALSVLAQDLQGDQLDITSRVRLQEGFLASVNLRCDPTRLNGYIGGVSDRDRLYVVRMHEGRTKVLSKTELPETLQGVHEDCWIRFQAERHRLRLKVWPFGQPEPEDWHIETEDRRLRAGLAGLAVSCYSPIVGGQPKAEACFDQVRISLPPATSPPQTPEPRALGR